MTDQTQQEKHEGQINDLQLRNTFDDNRKDLSDQRQDRAEEVARHHSEDLVTLRDIYDMADRRMSRVEDSVARLTNASNHRMERFEHWLYTTDGNITRGFTEVKELIAKKADAAAVNLAMEDKADKDELVTSWGVRLLRHGWFRAAMGTVMLVVITEAASQHWFIQAAQWFESLFWGV